MSSHDRIGNPITTYLGSPFWVHDPRPEEIEIEDIAHALSFACRFGGHSRVYYSVAQHSVLVSLECPVVHALYGLLHDAAEAYLADIPDPAKALLPDVKRVEAALWRAIAIRFGLDSEIPIEVFEADKRVFKQEYLLYMNGPPLASLMEIEDTEIAINTALGPPEAEILFQNRFMELMENKLR